MRRSPLTRRTGLSRHTRLNGSPRRVDRTDPARVAWKSAQRGFCECGCGRFSLHLERHHVVYEQHVRRECPELVWDLRNSMLLAGACHAAHHCGQRRIPIAALPDLALAFAVDVLGEEPAALYIARYYRTGRDDESRLAA